MTGPFTFDEARAAAREATLFQKQAEDFIRETAKTAAHAEEAYRKALAEEIIRQHNDGAAWTVAPDLARGNSKVAQLRRDRDIAEGVREAALQAAWRRTADRKDTQRFIDWSLRREMAEMYGQVPEPKDMPVIGGRRA